MGRPSPCWLVSTASAGVTLPIILSGVTKIRCRLSRTFRSGTFFPLRALSPAVLPVLSTVGDVRYHIALDRFSKLEFTTAGRAEASKTAALKAVSSGAFRKKKVVLIFASSSSWRLSSFEKYRFGGCGILCDLRYIPLPQNTLRPLRSRCWSVVTCLTHHMHASPALSVPDGGVLDQLGECGHG